MKRGAHSRVAPIAALTCLTLLGLTSLGLTSLALADPTSGRGAAAANPAREYFTDTVLLDQDGRAHQFYSDLIAGRIVIINEIFTGCRSSCPLIMARLAELQDLLGRRMEQVSILSISVDPVIDTPQTLRAYADAFNARHGWYFLTGEAGAVRTVMRKLGDRSSAPEGHSDVIVVGNDASGTWVKLTAVATTEDIAQAVVDVAAQR
jgi:cytochrome oxidase Cu insertion factor (SCO1/SenC/PrrC family)